jgi:hypothetical protein
VTQKFVDTLNNLSTDPVIAEQMRDNFMSYTAVLKDGRFKTDDYLSAVTYVSYKLMGYTNLEAWGRTFPNRYQTLLARNTSSKDIAAHVAAYNKGKLVNLIMEQSMVPSWVLNQELYQKALNVQADLMVNAMSEKVRSDAANSILTHLAKPKDNIAAQINIGIGEHSGMNELRDTLSQLAKQQQELINNGVSTKAIAAQTIIDVEAK